MKKIVIITGIICTLLTTGQAQAAKNLKKTVAVFEFENDSGYRNWLRMGADFSDNLTDSLVQSGKFIVLSRKDLDVVMKEQNLANSDRFAKSNTAKIGKIVPAQILVKGKIADFQENTSGGGQGLNIKGFKLGFKKSSAVVGVIVQLIDSTTGEILESKRVDGEAKSGGMDIGYSGAWDINSSDFKKTPVGKAVQMAIDRAVVYISNKLSDVDWQGKVVIVKDGTVYINAGENAGVQPGNTFVVYKEGEALIDPDTGINLGSERERVGTVRVTEVQEKFSKAAAEGFDVSRVTKGDLVLEK